MKNILCIFILAITFGGCCRWASCPADQVLCIPTFDGDYQSMGLDFGEFLIEAKNDPSVKFYYRNPPGFPEPVDCRSDVPGLRLNCKYSAQLILYGIERVNHRKHRLDSVSICVHTSKDCYIFDADPHHP